MIIVLFIEFFSYVQNRQKTQIRLCLSWFSQPKPLKHNFKTNKDIKCIKLTFFISVLLLPSIKSFEHIVKPNIK